MQLARTWLLATRTLEQSVEDGKATGPPKPVLGGVARFVGLDPVGGGSDGAGLADALTTTIGTSRLRSEGSVSVDATPATHYTTLDPGPARIELWVDREGRLVRLRVPGASAATASVLTLSGSWTTDRIEPPPVG